MEIKNAVTVLGSLAQESRLKTFRLLVEAGPDGMPAGVIAKRLEVPQATLSFHLNHLKNAGLIEARREGRSIIYALKVDGIRELMAFLTQDCCQGHPELCLPIPVEADYHGSRSSWQEG